MFKHLLDRTLNKAVFSLEKVLAIELLASYAFTH